MLPPEKRLASCLALAILLAAGVASAGADEGCQAWPGEPSPLPTTASPDPVAARWAELRVWELTRLARQAEEANRDTAYRLWFHIACLQPDSPDAREGLHLTSRVRVFRPALIDEAPARRPERARNAGQAIARLGGRVYVGAPSWLAETTPPVAAAPPSFEETPVFEEPPVFEELPVVAEKPEAAEKPDAEEKPVVAEKPDAAKPPGVEELLSLAEAQLHGAEYRKALATAEEARRLLDALPAGGELQEAQRARSEVIMATAEIALGLEDSARERFARTLRRDPGFELDPARTAPKVMRVLQAARAGAGSAP